MMRTYSAIFSLLFLVGACVRLGHIQQTEPIRTTKFTGSHKTVAQCIQRRVNGQVQDDTFAERYVIYDSVKGSQDQGLSHYSITVARTGPNQGIAEWRIVNPQGVDLADAMVRQYWTPIQDCVEQAKNVM